MLFFSRESKTGQSWWEDKMDVARYVTILENNEKIEFDWADAVKDGLLIPCFSDENLKTKLNCENQKAFNLSSSQFYGTYVSKLKSVV